MRVRRALTRVLRSEDVQSAAVVTTECLSCDILLIQPPIRDFYLTTKRTIPYGLSSIAATLRNHGYRVAILDALASGKSRPAPLPDPLKYLSTVYGPADTSPFALFHQYRHFGYALSTIADRARLSGAFLIGIASLFSAYEDMALATAQAVKSACPEAWLVLGGHHPSVFPDRMLDHPAVDFVLRGDGEVTLPALAQALHHSAALESVPGIAFTRKNGERHICPPAYAHDLNGLAPPAVDLVNNRFYSRKGMNTLVIATSRGCPLQCSYCCMGAHSSIPYRRRRVEHVMQEIIQAAQGREIGLIDFEDENMTMDRSWFQRLLREIIRHFGERKPELRAMNGIYPPTLDKKTIDLMQAAGFRELNLALITCDRCQSARFNRASVTQAFDRVLQWAEASEMTAVGYLIAGAPGQNPMTSVDDLLFLAARRVLVGFSIYYPAPDSLDFKNCQASGQLPASPLSWRSTALPLDHSARREAGQTLLRLARILNFMKYRIDERERQPEPEPFPLHADRLAGSRFEMGHQLVRWFLDDGIIRGVQRNGKIFSHPTDTGLTRAFIKGLQTISVCGVKQRMAR
jgi:anaerobic magnesium-protoporphyrin IX monomethyl ester cyclase